MGEDFNDDEDDDWHFALPSYTSSADRQPRQTSGAVIKQIKGI